MLKKLKLLNTRKFTVDFGDASRLSNNQKIIISNLKHTDDRVRSFNYINENHFNNKLNDLTINYRNASEHLLKMNSIQNESTSFLFGFGDFLSTIGTGTRFLKKQNINEFSIDTSISPYQSGLTTSLAWYDYKKFDNDVKYKPKVHPYTDYIEDSELKANIERSFYSGLYDGRFQNFARYLSELPPNTLRPNTFLSILEEKAKEFGCHENLKMTFYDKEWCNANHMVGLQAVGRGSQNYGLLEIDYKGNPSSDDFIVLIGKGVTFDTGGISLKPGEAMSLMKGDMGGSAVVTASSFYLAKSKTSINVKTLIPLVENSPDGDAILPGSVITYPNNKKVEIINTDAEGRLVLADALLYCQKAYETKPKLIIDLATLTGAITISLGDKFSGCFGNAKSMSTDLKHVFRPQDESASIERRGKNAVSMQIENLNNRFSIYNNLLNSSIYTGDAFWPMPLAGFHNDIKGTVVADIVNAVENKGRGGSSHAAVFLDNFVDNSIPWIHLDIASVFYNSSPNPIYSKGMTGRPTSSLNHFLRRLSKSSKN